MLNVLLDTNILILLIIGTWDREAIPRFKRTETFTAGDFDLLGERLRSYARVVTTPGVVTEASNLMGNRFHEIVADSFVTVCTPLVEIATPKNDVLVGESFPRLGFADASILSALDEDTVLLTDDLSLYLQALYQGLEAINFNHLRRFGP